MTYQCATVLLCSLFSIPFSWVNALIAVPRASPRVCKHAHTLLKAKEKRATREKEREGSTKGKGGLYKMLQIPALPPKCSRSDVTFHACPAF